VELETLAVESVKAPRKAPFVAAGAAAGIGYCITMEAADCKPMACAGAGLYDDGAAT